MNHMTPAVPLRRRVRLIARRLGIDVHSYQVGLDVDVRRARMLRDLRVDTVLDCGANIGEWATSVRLSGYPGRIVSFEPRADAYAALCETAAGDPLWRCLRVALGDVDADAEMNVAANAVSSSLLPMEAAHATAAPESAYVSSEAVHVVRLDSVVPGIIPSGGLLGLKLDLQGYEAAALRGSEGILANVRLIECELSVVALYQDQPLYRDMIALLDGLGFALASITEGMTDSATGHVLQVDAIFVRARDLDPEQQPTIDRVGPWPPGGGHRCS
jgi:FkbM family methyltransferase